MSAYEMDKHLGPDRRSHAEVADEAGQLEPVKHSMVYLVDHQHIPMKSSHLARHQPHREQGPSLWQWQAESRHDEDAEE